MFKVESKIVDVLFDCPADRWGQVDIIATFDNGLKKSLYTFYTDQLSLGKSDFIGLTEEEAHKTTEACSCCCRAHHTMRMAH